MMVLFGLVREVVAVDVRLAAPGLRSLRENVSAKSDLIPLRLALWRLQVSIRGASIVVMVSVANVDQDTAVPKEDLIVGIVLEMTRKMMMRYQTEWKVCNG